VVTGVGLDTSAAAAGLRQDDEILAIDEVRVRADQLGRRLEQFAPGAKVTLLIARRDQLMRLMLPLGTEPGSKWDLDVDPAATEAQHARLVAWLRPPS
jgi:predicted metalloprotease with PDZ domain